MNRKWKIGLACLVFLLALGITLYPLISTMYKTIYPQSSTALLIQPGRDLLTLMTCEYAPGGVKNRCLVICERVEAS